MAVLNSPAPSRAGVAPAGLYWNAGGAINCADHAPLYRGDLWTLESWQKISRADAAGMRAAGLAPCCEQCGKEVK